jgi:hypothetical protein
LKARLLPFGAPGALPPCIRQRPFGIAGDWQGVPAYQVTRLILSINLRTAGSLGLPIPPSILALADEVIE